MEDPPFFGFWESVTCRRHYFCLGGAITLEARVVVVIVVAVVVTTGSILYPLHHGSFTLFPATTSSLDIGGWS